MTRPPSGPGPRKTPDVHRENAGDDDDEQPGGAPVPAIPKPKPCPVLGAGAMELPTQADELISV